MAYDKWTSSLVFSMGMLLSLGAYSGSGTTSSSEAPLSRQYLVSTPSSDTQRAALQVPSSKRQKQSATAVRLPFLFEKNAGQTHNAVAFLARARGYNLFLTPSGATWVLKEAPNAPISMSVVGGNPNPAIEGLERQKAKSNYFVGNKSSEWRRDVGNYGKVQYKNVYAGIDLLFRADDESRLEYDFIVAPGADPRRIRVRFEGVEKVEIDEQGNLVLQTAAKPIVQRPPYLYQQVGETRREVSGHFIQFSSNEVGFALGAYDASLPLVIDPVISYSTYLGGGAADDGREILVDSSGCAYVVGVTNSLNLPMQSAGDSGGTLGTTEIFVAKLSPAGDALLFSTYIGSNGNDQATSLALDKDKNIYVTGTVFPPVGVESDFPVVNALQSSCQSPDNWDGIALKLNPEGDELLYSTFFGGTGNDIIGDIAVEEDGSAIIVGSTSSESIPLENAFKSIRTGGSSFWNGTQLYNKDGFIAKLTPNGNAVEFSTFFGGIQDDSVGSVAIGPDHTIYVAGWTASSDFPLQNPMKSSFLAHYDGYIARFDPSVRTLIFSTFISGSQVLGTEMNGTSVSAILVDSLGDVYAAGKTGAVDFPVAKPIQPILLGTSDAFVTKISASGQSRIFSTFLGGGDRDTASAIGRDASGNIYVAGYTASGDFPEHRSLFQTRPALQNGFVTSLTSTGDRIRYSTVLGGRDYDSVQAMDVTPSGTVFVIGETKSADFPMVSAYQDTINRGGGDSALSLSDSFVTKVSETRVFLR